MSLENLRSAQDQAMKWSLGVKTFWRAFLLELKSMKASMTACNGVSLRWRLRIEDSRLEDLKVCGMNWSFPPSGSYDDFTFVGMCLIEVSHLSRELEIEVIRFKMELISPGTIFLKVATKDGIYNAQESGLALPLRMHSVFPKFESHFLWRSTADNDKIAHRVAQWLDDRSVNSEFTFFSRRKRA